MDVNPWSLPYWDPEYKAELHAKCGRTKLCVVSLRQPDAIDDPLTAVLRSGARRRLAQAIEAEADAFLAVMKGMQLADGRDRVVRHGCAFRLIMITDSV